MQSKQEKDVIFIRLFPCEDIFEKLREVCGAYRIKTAVVLSGIGQLKDFKLGYFNQFTRLRIDRAAPIPA
jgi:predicted DNA-binding protein with PD1-like motif